jgi:hypothetical protein
MPELNTANATAEIKADSPELTKFTMEKTAGINYQKRRHEAWRDTYDLYRDIIHINALTQRQAVNIPIMKETKRTLLSRIDDPPSIFFDCLEKEAKGREKEIIINEQFQDDYDRLNFEAIDILEKDNVLLEGRTFKILNWVDGRFHCEVPGNLDIVIDEKTSPIDIETARYWTRLHIFKTLRDILADPKYSDEGKQALKTSIQTDIIGGILTFAKDETQESKDKILQDLDITNFDELKANDVLIELNEHFTHIWDDKAKKWVRYVQVWAKDCACLYNKSLKETLGVEFWPLVTWADDLDAKDFWCDGIGDTVRTPNKIANIYFSSMLENREYNNLSMYWYLPIPGYNPQTFEPEPFGQLPAPLVKNPDGSYMPIEQVIKQVSINKLEDSLVSIDFLIRLVERATAATAIEKGTGEKKQITLGEVEELVAKSAERIVAMAKFYRRGWKEFAWKWLKITEANVNDTDPIKLYKKGTDGSYFEKSVKKSDWYSDNGYRVRVQSNSEQESEQTESINKLIAVKAQMPNNRALLKVINKRMVDFLKLTPEEQKEIEDEQKQLETMGVNNPPGNEEVAPEAARLQTSANKLKEVMAKI